MADIIKSLGLVSISLRLLAVTSLAITQTSAIGQSPNAGGGARVAESPFGAEASTTSFCLLATTFYGTTPNPLQGPVRLYDVNGLTGAGSSPRTTAAPPLIGLAWAADNRLYGVSIDYTPGYQPNSVYRIDAVTGATTLIGATGLSSMLEGALATHPQTGVIYGVSLGRLFRLPGLSATTSSPTAQIVGNVNYPVPGLNWDISGLAFDSAGRLYAVTQSLGTSGPPAHLIRLDLNNVTNGTVPVDLDVTLSRRVRELGGLEFVGGTLFYAEGNQPGLGNGGTSNNLYPLATINPSTGVITPRGLTNIVNGVSSLVGCAPQQHFCTPPPPDLDAWYPMDGNGNDLVLGKNAVSSGNILFGGPWVGPFAFFSGGYMSVPDGPVLDQGLGDFSIDLWMVMLPGHEVGTRFLIDKRAIAGGSQVRGWSLSTSYGRLALQLGDGGFSTFVDNRVLPTGWRHVAVTVDRDNPQGIVFYIDGQPGAPLNPTGRQGSLDSTSPTYFARSALNGAATPALRLDEIEFFDRVLAAAEIQRIFGARQAGKCKANF